MLIPAPALALLLSSAASPSAPELVLDEARIDAVFAPYARTDGPGCAVGVVHRGELVLARGYGMANLEHAVPISPKTVFRIGSTSKQFTAACIVLAAQQGHLSLDDDVREHLPELPEYGETITLRHLLNHTSGLRDYLGLMSLAGHGDSDWYSNDEVLAMVARQENLNFPTGTQNLYSNTGYFLLSVVIERATGKTLAEFAEEHLFGPLGMEHSHFHDDHKRVVPNRADGYSRDERGRWRLSNTTLEMCGDGGVFTSVEDMLLWDRNFYEPKVGGEELVAALHEKGRLNDGTELDYALGLVVRDYRGLRMVSHGGAFVGFRAETVRFPDEELSVICFANLDAIDPTSLALRVADVVLEKQFVAGAEVSAAPAAMTRASSPPPAWVELDQGLVDRFAAQYLDHATGAVIDVSPDGNGLRFRVGAESMVLRPISEVEFESADPPAHVRFEPAVMDGMWTGSLRLRGSSVPIGPYMPWDPGFMTLDEYVGRYRSPELGVEWEFGADGGALTVELVRGETSRLAPIAMDAVRGPGALLVFRRDAFHSITSFELNAGRVQGIRFERVK